MATIFDVIDNFWGRDPLRKILRSDKFALARFRGEVNRFYDSYEVPAPPAGEFRTYHGGLVAVNFSLSGKQRTLFNNLLYEHSTVVPDPLSRWYFDRYEELAKTPPAKYGNDGAQIDQSEWMGWILNSDRAFRWSLPASRDVLHYFVSQMLPLRPLTEAGIVILVSQAHVLLKDSAELVKNSLSDAERTDFRVACDQVSDEQLPLWDNVRGGAMTASGGISADPKTIAWARAKEAAYHIRKNLAIASAASGYYVPENETDGLLLQNVVSNSHQDQGHDGWKIQISKDVSRLQLPSLEDLPLAELLTIRKDAFEFHEFRLWLARKLLSPTYKASLSQLELTSDEIESEIEKLRRSLENSSVIKRFMKENGLKITVSTVASMSAAAAIGQPLLGATVGALGGVLSSLVDRDAKKGVLAQIARMTRTSSDATYGRDGKPPGLPRPLSLPFLGEVRIGPQVASEQPYDTARLRQIVGQALEPNNTGNPYRAIR
jgi:hypothetical protein